MNNANFNNIDEKVREYLLPSKILEYSNGVANEQSLLNYNTDQSFFAGGECCVIEAGSYILLDFGIELNGGIKIVCNEMSGHKNGQIRIRFGESAMEAMSEIGEKFSTNDHAIRDENLTIPWVGSVEYGNTGFRFVRIDNVSLYQISIRQIFAVYVHIGKRYTDKFSCSDDRLTQIWETAARTVYLNMQDYVYDGIKRDRVVWIGDLHPEALSICCLFGCDKRLIKSIDLAAKLTPPNDWMNGIPSYSMWWLKILWDVYMFSGDKDYIFSHLPYIKLLTQSLFDIICSDGQNVLENRFIDWPSSVDPQAQDAGVHALLYMAIKSARDMICIFNHKSDELLKQKCNKYLDILTKRTPNYSSNKQAAALMVYAGLLDAEKVNREVLSVHPTKAVSTFLGCYVLQSRGKAGDIEGAINLMRDYWGAMLDLGATTFWEDFNIDWAENAKPIDSILQEDDYDVHGDNGGYCYSGFRHSLCHGWSSGPVAFLSRYVLGVKVVEPGCKTLRIKPNLGSLKWAEGEFPTPHGIVKIRHDSKEGKIFTQIDAPENITILRD